MINCKNCNHELSTADNYCQKCGAKHIRNRLTIRNLWTDFQDVFLNLDNNLLRTYIDLFKRPEEVIGGYINGLRKRYFGVFNYYALALTLAGFQIFIVRKYFPESLDITSLVPENTPQAEMDIGWSFDYFSLISLLSMPLYALMARLTFIKLKKFNYTEHLVIMTYIFAQYTITTVPFSLTGAILGFNYYIVGNIFSVLLMGYTIYCYKRLYPLTLEQAILRTLLFIGILAFLLLLSGIIQLVVLFLNGDLQQMIEAEQTKQGISYIISSAMNWTS